MSPNTPQAAGPLAPQHRRFLRTPYRLLNPHLRQQFEEHLDRADVIAKGPYVTLAREVADLYHGRLRARKPESGRAGSDR